MKGGELDLPPGFRFHPTDEELVMYYLCRKCASLSISVQIIAEIDLYKYDPWQLPGMASYGEKEWYFFSPRDRKYPNGSRPNRAAGSGYWKATGADKPIGKPSPIGIKKALVFYTGKAPRGVKTNWIMHEYRLANVDRSARKKSNSRQLDEWVLCRLYNKKGVLDDELNTETKPMIRSSNYTTDVPKSKINQNEMKMLPPPPLPSLPIIGSMPLQQHDLHYFDTSESVPRLHTDSSCSEHMVSPEFACEREVQSELRRRDWENGLDNKQMQFNASMDDVIALKGNPYESAFVDQNNQLSPLQDMFMFLDKPF